MTVDSDTIKYRCANSCMTGQVWFSKSRGLSASVSFLFSPSLPRSVTWAIFRALFDSRSAPNSGKIAQKAVGAGERPERRESLRGIYSVRKQPTFGDPTTGFPAK